MMSRDFFKKQLEILGDNFSKTWVTNERSRILWDFCENLSITDSSFQKAIESFIKNDEKPGIRSLCQKIKVIEESQGRVIKAEYYCDQCNNEFTIWVRRPEGESLLMMGCHLCKDENPDYWLPEGIPVYSPEFVILPNQVLKAVKKIDPDSLEINKGQYVKLENIVKDCLVKSKKYFNLSNGIQKSNDTPEKSDL